MASGAILIEYGDARALLMADAEEELWEEWLASGPPPALTKPVQFIKAAHHGSENGYYQPLYQMIADRNRTIAVITPFNQGNVHLPSRNGIHRLRPHVKEVYCTNLHSAAQSTALSWEPINSPALPAIPARWESDIVGHPALQGLLMRGGANTPATSLPRLPPNWATDLQKNPTLWQLLKPGIRLPTTGSQPVEHHTFSILLDTSGAVTSLQCGTGSGRLQP